MQTKICTKCGIEKEITEFFQSKNGKFGKSAECKRCNCLARYARARKKNKSHRIPTLLARENRKNGIKYCPKCQQTKPIDNFHRSGKSNSGVASHCKECANLLGCSRPKEEKQKRYQRDKKKLKNTTLKREFGISLDEYNKKLHNQNHQCACCGSSEKENGKMLAVDHNHETKEIRDLLCGKCNAAIGFLDESVKKAEKIIQYIKKWTKNGVSQNT